MSGLPIPRPEERFKHTLGSSNNGTDKLTRPPFAEGICNLREIALRSSETYSKAKKTVRAEKWFYLISGLFDF